MLESLIAITKIFQKYQVDYCLIGGLAMMLHHGRANTVDIDFYVLVDDLETVMELFKKENVPAETRGEYQLKARINGIQIDILYADHYIGSDVVHRAVEKKLGNDLVRVATPEDIIILKTIANRTIDLRDIEELRELFGKKLDEDYITRKLTWLKKQLDS